MSLYYVNKHRYSSYSIESISTANIYGAIALYATAAPVHFLNPNIVFLLGSSLVTPCVSTVDRTFVMICCHLVLLEVDHLIPFELCLPKILHCGNF